MGRWLYPSFWSIFHLTHYCHPALAAGSFAALVAMVLLFISNVAWPELRPSFMNPGASGQPITVMHGLLEIDPELAQSLNSHGS
jgi:hypothetical protein